ncbi:TadE/TadG family type IV pilus assembly protein [uncultured Slackia sp.]|uniref:TadE/TadG family type IV pilus assembly protein n=1 Tax=uncultured Slackia sp. TaxID=665903 RepID=UPI0026E0A42F|nr:TadE family protein [uncultured Slackia sp.]
MFCSNEGATCGLAWRATRQPIVRRTARSGQASVEAAFLAPVLLLGFLLLIQPGIVLYDRAIMESAASEGCRLLETRSSQSEAEVRAYIERRLEAVPGVDAFHAGEWLVEFSGSQADDTTTVSIEHSLKPLPLVGAAMGFAGMLDGRGLYRQEASCVAAVRDEWLTGSEHGCDPEAWIERWDEKV